MSCIFLYDDNSIWIDAAHRKERRKVLGARAGGVELCRAIAASCALFGLSVLITSLLGRDISARILMIVAGLSAADVALWFHVDGIWHHMLDVLNFVINIPFQIAFLAIYLVLDYQAPEQRHHALNRSARMVFGWVTGCPSNLTFPMDAKDILGKLPTRV